MQRSYLLRWLALPIGVLATQCLDSISDDCTKTLTCEDDDQPTLQPDCVWRYRNGREWVGAPRFDSTTGKWRWPDGKETDTQTFECNVADAGGDAGPSGPDCRLGTPCDAPFVCDYVTGACVECVEDAQCSSNVPVGDAGAAIVCDPALHECVPCLRNEHCTATGNTLVCKVNPDDSKRNECVQCQADEDCSLTTPATPVCDETSNDCTTACTSTSECGGDKPVCNLDKQVCVECLGAGDCRGAEGQCNTTTNECVECIDDVPCAAADEVCDTTRNLCVQCRTDLECANAPNGATRCDTDTNLCVQCLDDVQCSVQATSRCNLATHTCVGCTADTQCEGGFRCNQLLGGTCVECLGDGDCTSGLLEHTCETTTGQCVECLATAQCPRADSAHCETQPNVPSSPQYSCVGCRDNTDCGGKAIPGLCNTVTGVCVNCVENGDCADDPTRSRCQNGTCAVCSLDSDCLAITGLGACLNTVGCVECVNDNHCEDNPDGAVCKSTAGPGSAAVNTCVQCVDDADCPSPTASACSNDNRCVACASDDDCSHVRSGNTVLGLCDAGTCVQCTGPRRAACGMNVCNSITRQCTSFPVASAELCETCVSDAHCAASQRCATHLFGSTNVGNFCFPVATGTGTTCNLTPYSIPTTLTTLDGVSTSLCMLRRTTCEGIADFGNQSCDVAADCGVASLDDGRCATDTCSIPCTDSTDCFDPSPNSCLGGFCQ
jgi:hypothetical protein